MVFFIKITQWLALLLLGLAVVVFVVGFSVLHFSGTQDELWNGTNVTAISIVLCWMSLPFGLLCLAVCTLRRVVTRGYFLISLAILAAPYVLSFLFHAGRSLAELILSFAYIAFMFMLTSDIRNFEKAYARFLADHSKDLRAVGENGKGTGA